MKISKMYVAEIKGKLPSSIRKSEDVLTSNVFSFFNYAKRTIYLKALMNKLRITVNEKELNEAEFLFWPTYEDGTEPDLVLIIGKFYILFEAKYYSGFGKETATAESQLVREIKRGLMEADNLGKRFILVAITADYFYKPSKYKEIAEFKKYFKWINWQIVAEILLKLIETYGSLPNKLFALDLLRLLEFKKLRPFRSFKDINFCEVKIIKNNLFFSPETAMHRGKFIGFKRTLINIPVISNVDDNIFYANNYFNNLPKIKKNINRKIFFGKEN